MSEPTESSEPAEAPDWAEPTSFIASGLEGEALVTFLHERFQATPLHGLLGIGFPQGLDLDEHGGVVVEMPVAPAAMNASGNLHGGAIATLIDISAGTCAARNALGFVPGQTTIVTADLHVRYLGRPKGQIVRAVSRPLRAGRQLTVVECQVADELGNLIAVADFSAMLVTLRNPLPGALGADNRGPDL